MSTNNWMAVMDKIGPTLQREVTLALRDIKICFDREGRSFDKKFKKYFLHVLTNSLTAAYSNFEMELLLNECHTESNVVNEMNGNSIDSAMFHVHQNVGSSNRFKENVMHSENAAQEEASTSDTVLILDSSDDEEDSHKQSIASTTQKTIVENELVLVNDVILDSEDDETASMIQNQNNKRNDGTEMKKESIEPKQEETNDGNDIPLVLVPVNPRIQMQIMDAWMDASPKTDSSTNEISHNASSEEGYEYSNKNKQGTSNDIISRSLDKNTGQKSAVGNEVAIADGVAMGNGHGSTASMSQNRNSKHNDGSTMNNVKDDSNDGKKEVERMKEATSIDQVNRQIQMTPNETPMDVSPNAETITNKTSHQMSNTDDKECLNKNMPRKSNFSNNSLANKKKAKQTKFKRLATTKTVSKVAKKHKCRFCEYSSNFSKDLERHERTHTGVKPYQCKRCNKRFTHLTVLKRHAKVHAKEFAFHCPGCFQGFSQKTEQEAHVKVCKVTRYECDICEKNSFVVKCDLERHMRTHSGEKPFRCEICSIYFRQKIHLKRHLNTIHNRSRHCI